jgi:acylpyruvate hydrolase
MFKLRVLFTNFMKKYIFKDNVNRDLTIGKLVCLARTYKMHAKEMKSEVPKEPLLFLKPASSIIYDQESIIIPKKSKCLHHEVELGIVIGKKCKNIPKNKALDYVLGYLLALDITARDIQDVAKKNGLPWGIAKGFDTFAPISNVVLKEKIKNPQNIDISLKVNGQLKQKSNTSFMIFSIEEIIEFISEIMTLEPGDLILTGTPEGVGEIKSGDIIEADLENICSLKIFVR